MTESIVTLLLAALLGSFPTAYILGRYVKGIDIRSVGSKNPGAVNAASGYCRQSIDRIEKGAASHRAFGRWFTPVRGYATIARRRMKSKVGTVRAQHLPRSHSSLLPHRLQSDPGGPSPRDSGHHPTSSPDIDSRSAFLLVATW